MYGVGMWKILQHFVLSPLTGLLALAVPLYTWLAIGGSTMYRL